MLRKEITYENLFTGATVTEEHFFHISKSDLIQMELEEHAVTYTDKNGKLHTGMQAHLTRVVESEDGKVIMAEFKEIIRRSYGRKEGNNFRKSQEIWDDFSSSEAFSQLIFEICTNADAAAEFVRAIVPGNLEQEVKAATEEARSTVPAIAKLGDDTIVLSNKEDASPRVLTAVEMAEMDADELKSGLATGRYKLA